MLDAFVYDTTPLQDRLVQTAMAESRAHSDRDVPGSSSKENAQKATRRYVSRWDPDCPGRFGELPEWSMA